MEFILEDFNSKLGRESILNQQLGMRAYIRIVMIKGVE
jgi:hypothetical protein